MAKGKDRKKKGWGYDGFIGTVNGAANQGWRGESVTPVCWAIYQAGGIIPDGSEELSDVRRSMGTWLFRKNGLGLDEMAEMLGFDGESELLEELWAEHRKGRKYGDKVPGINMSDEELNRLYSDWLEKKMRAEQELKYDDEVPF